MGCIMECFYKKGADASLRTGFKSLHEIPVVDIDGKMIEKLGDILEGKRCILIVNVASK